MLLHLTTANKIISSPTVSHRYLIEIYAIQHRETRKSQQSDNQLYKWGRIECSNYLQVSICSIERTFHQRYNKHSPEIVNTITWEEIISPQLNHSLMWPLDWKWDANINVTPDMHYSQSLIAHWCEHWTENERQNQSHSRYALLHADYNVNVSCCNNADFEVILKIINLDISCHQTRGSWENLYEPICASYNQ